MKVIYNNFIPFSGFKAINLFGVLFVRGNRKINEVTINHEEIHTSQMKELLYLGFYLIYFLEWLIRLFFPGNAYRKISFEREAYLHQEDLGYLGKRKHFSQWR